MRNARPPPALFHSQPNTQVPSALATASHVYVRHDAQRSPLQRPYDGPYRVLDAGDKTFLVDKNGKPYRVSIDRLKPAILSPTPSAEPGSSTPAPSTALSTSAPCPTPPVTSRPSATTSLQPASPSVPPQKITRSGRISRLPPRFR